MVSEENVAPVAEEKKAETSSTVTESKMAPKKEINKEEKPENPEKKK